MMSKGKCMCVLCEHIEGTWTQSWGAEGFLVKERCTDVKDKQSQAKEEVGGQGNDENVLREGAACGKA